MTVMMILLCEKVIESHSQLVSLHLWEQPSDGGAVRNLFLGAIAHFVLKWVDFLLQKIWRNFFWQIMKYLQTRIFQRTLNPKMY